MNLIFAEGFSPNSIYLRSIINDKILTDHD